MIDVLDVAAPVLKLVLDGRGRSNLKAIEQNVAAYVGEDAVEDAGEYAGEDGCAGGGAGWAEGFRPLYKELGVPGGLAGGSAAFCVATGSLGAVSGRCQESFL